MSWSIPVMRVAGIGVRVHILFILLVAVELLRAVFPAADADHARLSIALTCIWIAALFSIILLHEFGHCITCRRWGGAADEILMWPLGGLAYCAPPDNAKAHFWTAAGGPLVNVLILCVTAPTLGILTGRWLGVALPSPVGLTISASVTHSWFLIALYLTNWLALVLLLFNLLPMFPMDGGRLLQSLLWPRLGYNRSMRVAVRIGYVGAIVLGLYGVLSANWLLVGLAIFGGLTCRQTVRELDFTEETMGEGAGLGGAEGRVYVESLEASRKELAAERDGEAKRRAAEAALRKAEEVRRANDVAEFDRILDKIRTSGIGSLTPAERRVLERETERKRGAKG